MKVVLDIETIPCSEDVQALLPEVEPPSNVSADPSRLEKWHAQDRAAQIDHQYRRTALDPSYGRVFCIGYLAFEERFGPQEVVTLFGNDERALLERFWQTIGRWKDAYIITHNGLQFDLPFLWKRSVVNRIRPSVDFKLTRYRTDLIFDTMAVWTNWEPRSGIKLETLAAILGVGQKSGSGAAVYELWKNREYRAIAEYCANDVYLTYACYCRMTFGEIRPREALKLAAEEVVQRG